MERWLQDHRAEEQKFQDKPSKIKKQKTAEIEKIGDKMMEVVDRLQMKRTEEKVDRLEKLIQDLRTGQAHFGNGSIRHQATLFDQQKRIDEKLDKILLEISYLEPQEFKDAEKTIPI